MASSAFAAAQVPSTSEQSVPSHPYGMYPQALGVSRSASTATATTLQGGSSSTESQGPAHPYTLYPQTVSSEDTTDDGAEMNTLPVGFLGHGQQFHRRRGPEGEEQDIVGPNGHLEQLPPYTRYADTFNAKSTAAGLLSANTDAEPGSRSDEPLMEMHERNGAELFAHEANASDPAREAARVESPEVTTHEKPAKRSIWIERGKVKLCGFLPLWVLLLAILFVVLVAAICGSVVGTFLRGRPKRLGDPLTDGYRGGSSQSASRFVDASPIATPSSLAALPSGSFKIALDNAYGHSDTCLIEYNQQPAWSCDFPDSQASLEVEIGGDANAPSFSLLNSNAAIDYGTQPPVLQNQTLVLVNDLNNASLGPAYHFQTFYNKLVVLPEDTFPPSSNKKRQAHSSGNYPPPPPFVPTSTGIPWWATRHRVNSGEMPWFCWWNETFVEAFIYLDERPSLTASAASSTSTSNSQAFTSTPPAYFTPSTTTASPSSTPPAKPPSTTQSSTSSTSCTSSSSSYSLTQPLNGQAWGPPYHSSSATPTGNAKRDANTTGLLPKLFKLEERLLSGSHPAPTCTQMSKGSNGAFTVHSTAGSAAVVPLAESDPVVSYVDTRRRRSNVAERDSSSGCYCQWSS